MRQTRTKQPQIQIKPYENFIHPYIFVLKEGNEIHTDFLDYSLLMLQVGQADILPSPKKRKPFVPNFHFQK